MSSGNSSNVIGQDRVKDTLERKKEREKKTENKKIGTGRLDFGRNEEEEEEEEEIDERSLSFSLKRAVTK